MIKKITPLKILFCHYAIVDKEGFGRTFMLARELAAKGHDVTFFTVFRSGSGKFFPVKEERDNVHMIIFPEVIPDFFRRTGFGLLSLFSKCLSVLNRSFDVVHADNGHRPSAGWPARIHRAMKGSKYVTEWWDFFGKGGQYDDLSFSKKLTKGFYDRLTEIPDKKNADFVVVLSEEMKTRALSAGIPGSKLKVINGGSDVKSIRYFPHTGSRKRWGIPESALVFGFIGMNEGEFLDIVPFVNAVVKLRDKIPVIWFTTGRKLDEKIKKEFNIGSELVELGWLPYEDYSEAISCADVFLMTQADNTCNRTRWPNKLGDYLAAGRMVLTNPVGDITKMIDRYPASFISTEFSAEAIASEIERLHEVKGDLLARGRDCRILAENEMSWASKATDLESIYYELHNIKE